MLHFGQLRAEHLPGHHDAAADGRQGAQADQPRRPYLQHQHATISNSTNKTPLQSIACKGLCCPFLFFSEPRTCMLPGPPCGSGAGALSAGVCDRPAVRLSAVPRPSRAPSAASVSNSASSLPSTSYATAAADSQWTLVRPSTRCALQVARTCAVCVVGHAANAAALHCIKDPRAPRAATPLRSTHQRRHPPPAARLHAWLCIAIAVVRGPRMTTARASAGGW